MTKTTTTVLATSGPLLIDVLGVSIPALSMLMGLLAVLLVRVMLMAKEVRSDKGFWYYNISLTILMAFIAFAIIADKQLGPGMAVMVGTGVGASGMVLVDILKDRVENAFKVLIGRKDDDTQ
jgi:predicted small integral membrane protein